MSSYRIFIIFINIFLIINNNFVNIVNSQNLNENSNEIDCEHFDIIGFVPFKEVSQIISNAINNDDETNAAAKFLQSQEFKNLLKRVLSTIQNPPLLGFVGGIGLHVADIMDHLTEQIRIQNTNDLNYELNYNRKNRQIQNHHVHNNHQEQQQIGVGGVVRKIISILPTDKIRHCYNLQLNSRPAFKHVIEQMHTPEFQNAVENVRQNEQYQALSSQLEERGIELNNWIIHAMDFFGVRQQQQQ